MVYCSRDITRSPHRLILNFYLKLLTSVTILLLGRALALHDYQYTAYTDVLDLTSRFFLNDFFMNSYYVLWTNFTYIPLLFTGLLFLYSYNYLKTLPHFVWLLTLFYFETSIIIYYDLNLHPHLGELAGTHFNGLLLNSINKFHPALFYVTLLLSTHSLYPFTQSRPYSYSKNHVCKVLHRTVCYWLPMIVWTLFLGSWWALQEGSWGGWWNWDPSEVFGLLVMVLYLLMLHREGSTRSYIANCNTYHLYVMIVLLTYLFIQLNFDLVSHNFGTRVDQFIDQSHTFILTLILVLIGLLILIINTLSFFRASHLLGFWTPTKLHINWQSITSQVITIVLLSSFSLLVNDFYWKFFQTNTLNNLKLTHLYGTLTLLLLLTRLWGTAFYTLVYLTSLIVLSKNVVTSTLILPKMGTASLLHIASAFLLLCMFLEAGDSVGSWGLVSGGTHLILPTTLGDLGICAPVADGFLINQNTLEMSNNLLNEPVWNFIGSSSTVDGHAFTHPLSGQSTIQSLWQDAQLFLYTISVSDAPLSSTHLLFLLALTLLLRTIHKQLKFYHNKIY